MSQNWKKSKKNPPPRFAWGGRDATASVPACPCYRCCRCSLVVVPGSWVCGVLVRAHRPVIVVAPAPSPRRLCPRCSPFPPHEQLLAVRLGVL